MDEGEEAVVITEEMAIQGERLVALLVAEGVPPREVAALTFIGMVRQWLGEDTLFTGDEEGSASFRVTDLGPLDRPKQ